MSQPFLVEFTDPWDSAGRIALGYCTAPSLVTPTNIESQLTRHLRQKRSPSCIYVFGDIEERDALRISFENSSVKNRISGLTGAPRIIPVLFDKMSCRVKAYEGDWKTVSTPTNCLSRLRAASMQATFRDCGGMLYAGEDHHYEKPSGKHCSQFIRTANILHASSAVRLLSFWLAEKLDEAATYIYADTSTIHPLIFQAAIHRFSSSKFLSNITIDSFRSYEGLKEYEFSNPKRSLVIVSASTSGDLVDRLIEEKRIPEAQIITLFYLGSSPSKGTVLCNLTKHPTVNPIGYDPIESYPGEDCPLCHKYSTATLIVGDQFLTEKPKVSSHSITADDAPKWLKPMMDEFRHSDLFRVQKYSARLGTHENLAIEPLTAFQDSKLSTFQSHIEQSIDKSIPASTKNIIYIKSDGAKLLAERIARHLGKFVGSNTPSPILAADLSTLEDRLAPGTVVVVADTLTDGRDLLAISRQLRDNHSTGAIIYFIGFVACESAAYFNELKTNLTYSGQRKAGTFVLESIRTCYIPRQANYLPWERELKVYSALKSYCEQNDLPYPEMLVRREDEIKIGGGQGLYKNVFLPHVNTGDALRIRKDFALLNTNDSPEKIFQSTIFAAISVVMNTLRTPTKSGSKLAMEINHTTVISPNNFDRFNDGIIQSSLLRSALPSELAYRKDEKLSTTMTDIMKSIFSSWKNDHGEAGYEFLLAMLTGTLTLLDNDLKILSTLLKSSDEPSGFFRVGGIFLARHFEN